MNVSPAEVALYGRQTWRTRDGRTLTWSAMTPAHLRNCARFLTMQTEDAVAAVIGCLGYMRGEEACHSADNALMEACDRQNEAAVIAEAMTRYAHHREVHG